MALRDLLPSYLDDEEEYDAPRRRAFRDTGHPEDLRQALRETVPETQGYAERFGRGLLHDVGELGYALGAPVYYGAREAYRTARDPAAQAEKYSALLGKIAEDPYGTAKRVGSAIGGAIIEPYQRREGEHFGNVVARNLLDRPLATLMDASALVGIPAGAAAKAGVAGAEGLAGAARAIDPLTLAGKATRGVLKAPDAVRTLAEEGPLGLYEKVRAGTLKTSAPDAIARLEASREITRLASDQKTRSIAEHNAFAREAADVFKDLDPTDKALFFPYVEGRLKAITEGPETGVLQELGPDGLWKPRGVDDGRLARLAVARERYLPILDRFEMQMGWKPEQAGHLAADAYAESLKKQGLDPLLPEHQAETLAQYDTAFREAEERAQMRRTLSVRTSLDAAKDTQFKTDQAAKQLQSGADAAKDRAASYPPKRATPEEAMAVWGPQGGLYFPHSGEVFTRDQVTLGNVLTKLQEAVPWKKNTAAAYASGALDTMDPEKALLRTHAALRGGIGRAEILDALGQKFGVELDRAAKIGLDEDFRAGTHQLLRPGQLHQEAALGEAMQDLLGSLMRHGDDPAVAGLNLQELAERAAKGIDLHFPMRSDLPTYKVPSGVAKAIKNWSDSFQPPTNPMWQALDASADPFNFVTLNLRPARIVNNLVGNSIFQVLEGITPFTSTGIGALSDMASALAYKAGLSKSAKGEKLAKVFDLPGVSTGGVTAAQEYASRTETLLREHPLAKMLGGKQLANYGATMQRLNEHVENSARALSTLFELRKQSPGLLARMAGAAKTTMDLGDQIEALAAKGARALDDADYAGALKNVNRFLNDYGRTSALERTVLRRIFPYQKFYRHAIELAARTPFEQPLKTGMLRSLGKAAKQDFEETLSQWGFDPQSMVMPWQQSSVPVDVQLDPETGRPVVRLLNLQGPSPFSLLDASGDPGQEALAALHPAIKAGLEVALGVNLFTMQPFEGPTTTFSGREVDPATGLVNQATTRPGPIAQFARQFFPVQLAKDLLAGERQPLDAASLADQLIADFEGTPGMAYKVDERGEARTRPKASPWARLFVPVPSMLEAPTEDQQRAQKSTITEQYRNLGRARPDLQETLRERRREAARRRREQVAAEGRPYRVRPRPE